MNFKISSFSRKVILIAVIIVFLYICILSYSLDKLSTFKFQEKIEENEENSVEINIDKSSKNISINVPINTSFSKHSAIPVTAFASNIKWIGLGDIHILGAYLDLRKSDETYIRILTLLTYNKKLNCIYNDKVIQSIPYEFNENHGYMYRGFIHSCKVPKASNNLTIVLQEPATNAKLAIPLKILKINENPSIDFSICVPPIFGHIDVHHLIAFFEMNILLGAQHFYIYLFTVNDATVKHVLDYYTSKKLASVYYWTIPSNKIWYNGQMSNIHHCLYETIGKSRYTMFQDLDEIFVPMVHNSWHQMMRKLDDGTHCGFKVSSIFVYSTSKKPPIYIKPLSRSTNINTVRSKCIVRPELIFEQGIHHISKQNVEIMTPIFADTNYVLLFHFRKCDMMFGFDCDQKSKESRLSNFVSFFKNRYDQALLDIIQES